MVPPAKVYLGDGVYAAFAGATIVLTTENGIRVTNEIALEPDVFDMLVKYSNSIWGPVIKVPPVKRK